MCLEDEDANERYIQNIEEQPEKGLSAVDVLVVARLNRYVHSEGHTQMGKMLEAAIDKFAPGSKVVILGPEFEPVIMPDEESMKRLGWVKITRA